MSDQAVRYKGYDILPVKEPKSRKVIGYDVPMIHPPNLFRTKNEAKQAIEARIAQLYEQYKKYL